MMNMLKKYNLYTTNTLQFRILHFGLYYKINILLIL